MKLIKRAEGIFLCLLLTFAVCGCVSTAAENNDKDYSFTAEVTEIMSDGGVLCEPEGSSEPEELLVYSKNMPELSLGSIILVEYDGQVTRSLPGKIYGATVTVVKK